MSAPEFAKDSTDVRSGRAVSDSPGPRSETRPSRTLVIVAICVGIGSLVPAGFAMFLAQLMTYGLYSWQQPQLDPAIWLPLLAFSLSLSLGPAMMIRGPDPRRWLKVAAGVFVTAAALGSLVTWVPVAA